MSSLLYWIIQSVNTVYLSIYWSLWFHNFSLFLSYRSCTYFIRFISKYCIYRAIVDGIVFLISISNCSLASVLIGKWGNCLRIRKNRYHGLVSIFKGSAGLCSLIWRTLFLTPSFHSVIFRIDKYIYISF